METLKGCCKSRDCVRTETLSLRTREARTKDNDKDIKTEGAWKLKKRDGVHDNARKITDDIGKRRLTFMCSAWVEKGWQKRFLPAQDLKLTEITKQDVLNRNTFTQKNNEWRVLEDEVKHVNRQHGQREQEILVLREWRTWGQEYANTVGNGNKRGHKWS